jgi:hypothetical protein
MACKATALLLAYLLTLGILGVHGPGENERPWLGPKLVYLVGKQKLLPVH